MCGRYQAKGDGDAIAAMWRAPRNEVAEEALGRTEVKPTTTVAVLAAAPEADGGVALEAVRWGIQPAWSKRPLLNARSDKLAESKLWKRLAGDHSHRVLLIADGWYEWLRPEVKSADARPQPFLHTVDGGALFGMAGVLDVAVVKGEVVPAVTVITTDAVGESARLHHRMPVVLADEERQRAWLSPGLATEDAVELCRPLAAGVAIEPAVL